MRDIVWFGPLENKTYQLYGEMGLISYLVTKITNIQGMMPLKPENAKRLKRIQ